MNNRFAPTNNDLISQGKPRFGILEHPVDSIDFTSLRYYSPLRKPLGAFAKHKNCKHFYFASIVNAEHILAVAYLKTWQVSTWFVYHYHLPTKQFTKHQVEDMLGLVSNISIDPHASQSYTKKAIHYSVDQHDSTHRIHINTPSISVDVHYPMDSADASLALCSPVGVNGFSYTHKKTGLPVSGHMSINGKAYTLTDSSLLNFDWTAGLLRPQTFWHWASMAGFAQDTQAKPRKVGLNLAAGVNETGMSENAYWVDGERFTLNFSKFDYGDYADISAHKPWHVSADDCINLTFTPFDGLYNKQSKGIIAVDFKQIFGVFSGEILHKGERLIVDNIVGFVEYQYIQW